MQQSQIQFNSVQSEQANSTAYNEAFNAAAQVRPHWQDMLAFLDLESPEKMLQRTQEMHRQVRESGAAYHVYADSKGSKRPWTLDLLPLILPSAEWKEIESAVIQRAVLLNKILIDIYGEQQLLHNNSLPAALIYNQTGFLRPCHGIEHANQVALHIYAVDLSRDADGHWVAIADRAQAPAGMGYTLENRLIISRAFPELFRDLKVEHIASFFASFRDSLATWGQACADKIAEDGIEPESPLIVLLTPGIYNETYYEHAFLARYLGFRLVEGHDLTVRNGKVWLKTLSGLRCVHVIVRRLNDDYCDPLELRVDSALGVPGLTDVVRQGNVVITNSLGSNILESNALMGFLPQLSQQLLGEPLKLNSLATWWCGEPEALEYVIRNLDHLVIKADFPHSHQQNPINTKNISAKERNALIEQMRAHPHHYVAQQHVKCSQAPIWKDGLLKPHLSADDVVLRVFACATPEGYIVMPGGLTRVANAADSVAINMQQGYGSKDTWVQTTDTVNTFSLLRKVTREQHLVRGNQQLSSRMVENLFWFGRYAARCDNIARLTRIALNFLLYAADQNETGEWKTVQSICQFYELIHTENNNLNNTDGVNFELELIHSVWSSNSQGLASNLNNLCQVATQLRERMSADNWRILNKITRKLTDITRPPSLIEGQSILNESILALVTLTGFALDGMTHDEGWYFLILGRRIERLQFICTVIIHALQSDRYSRLEWLLELSDSIITYHSRYMSQPEILPVMDLLILDDANPRSVIYQVNGLLKELFKLLRSYNYKGVELLLPLQSQLLGLNPTTNFQLGNVPLIELLGDLKSTSSILAEQLDHRFFSYADGQYANNAIKKSYL